MALTYVTGCLLCPQLSWMFYLLACNPDIQEKLLRSVPIRWMNLHGGEWSAAHTSRQCSFLYRSRTVEHVELCYDSIVDIKTKWRYNFALVVNIGFQQIPVFDCREIDDKLPRGTDPDYDNTSATALPYLNGVGD